MTLKQTLLAVADIYVGEAEVHGGKSLARISTIVLNQGGFFDRLRSGKTCTLDSFEAVLRWFSDADNWPARSIPEQINTILRSPVRDLAGA